MRVSSQPLLVWLQVVSILSMINTGWLVEGKDDRVEPTTVPSSSASPSQLPSTIILSETPNLVPTSVPSTVPSMYMYPSALPSLVPSELPTMLAPPPSVSAPTFSASPSTSSVPTGPAPSSTPSTLLPSTSGSLGPSIPPSLSPSASALPTSTPTTASPTITASPTPLPSIFPSEYPSTVPSIAPTDSVPPSASPAPSIYPSDFPSIHPTETTGPSPSPTDIPSFQPSLSVQPTAAPSLSQVPTKSASPSLFPSLQPSATPSQFPTTTPSSNQPSVTPTSEPSKISSVTPTNMPTITPSQFPTLVLKSATKATIEMRFINMPVLTNESDILIWEQVTSDHVMNYWNGLPSTAVIVDAATTDLIRIEEQIAGRRRRLQADRTSYVYSQNITYGVVRDTTLTENNIFLRPFQLDQSDYGIALVQALQLDPLLDMLIAEILIIENSPSGPPVESPTDEPPVDDSPKSGGVSTLVIVIVVALALLVFLATLVSVCYYLRGRQRENEQNWSSEQQRAAKYPVENALPPSQININGGDPKEYDSNRPGNYAGGGDDASDMEPYSVSAGSYLEKDEAYQVRDEFEDPPIGQDASLGPPTSSLLGADFDTDEEEEQLNDAEHLIMSTPLDNNRVSSYGSSLDDTPSLSAFNVQVTDIDDGIDNDDPYLM